MGKRILCGIVLTFMLMSFLCSGVSAAAVKTDFITTSTDVDELLKRPYTNGVPLGYSEDVYSLYQPGWGFDNRAIYRSGCEESFGMKVELSADGNPVNVGEAVHRPSHVTMKSSPDQVTYINHALDSDAYKQVSFAQTSYGNTLGMAFDGDTSDVGKNWNTFDMNPRTGDEWLEVFYQTPKALDEVRLWLYTDSNISAPRQVQILYWDGAAWKPAFDVNVPSAMTQGLNIITLDTAVSTAFRFIFTPAEGKALAFYEIELMEAVRSVREINHAMDTGSEKQVSFAQTAYGCTLDMAFDGDTSDVGKNWNTWDLNMRTGDEWLEITLPEARNIDLVRLWCFDQGVTGNMRAPKVTIYSEQDGQWAAVSGQKRTELNGGVNTVRFDRTNSNRFRMVFTPLPGNAMGFYEIQLVEEEKIPPRTDVTGYKYISPDNMAVVVLDVENTSNTESTLRLNVTPLYSAAKAGAYLRGEMSGFTLLTAGSPDFTASDSSLTSEVTLQPGEKRRFLAVTAFADQEDAAENALAGIFADEDPIETQRKEFCSWFTENIPYVDFPDESMKRIYYFRWYTYRNHIRHLADDSYVITEFLPYVGWSGAYNTINMAVGSHAAEGRWIRDTRYLSSYLTFWTEREGTATARSFSNWIPTAFYDYYLVTRDPVVPKSLEALKRDYEGWEKTNYDSSIGLFFSNNGADGMEYSVVNPTVWGADGYRPTVNAYRYGDAKAISALCTLAGDEDGAALYEEKAEALRQKTEELLFDEESSFYKWILRGEISLTEPKELIGYVPWMFGLPADTPARAEAWKYLTDSDYFAAPYGPRTAEKKYARITPESEYGSGVCRWDGPSWPFATSQTLNAMARLLSDYENHGGIEAEDYVNLLKTYANSHYKNGYPWLAENLDADTGRWIADVDRSPNYNHSEYVNLVITGLFGLRPEAGEDVVLNPLVPEEWDWFCLENVPYNGKNVTVLFDRDGSHYGAGEGFRVILNGEEKHVSPKVERVRIHEAAAQPGNPDSSAPESPATGDMGLLIPGLSVLLGGTLVGTLMIRLRRKNTRSSD